MKTTPQPNRPKQTVPKDLVADLLGTIHRQFCPEVDSKTWFKEYNSFIRLRVVLWPAKFMNEKGFVIPADRYKEILLKVLNEVKANGQTGKVRYWPGYLTHCMQQHWAHHWEEYYAEAKSAQSQVNLAMGILSANQNRQQEDQVTALGIAHDLLTANRARQKKKQVKKSAPSEIQPSLF